MTSLTGQCEHFRAKLNEAVHNLEAMQLESKANRCIDRSVCHVLSVVYNVVFASYLIVCIFYIFFNRETILRLVSEAKKHEKTSSLIKELQEVTAQSHNPVNIHT